MAQSSVKTCDIDVDVPEFQPLLLTRIKVLPLNNLWDALVYLHHWSMSGRVPSFEESSTKSKNDQCLMQIINNDILRYPSQPENVDLHFTCVHHHGGEAEDC